MLDGVVSNVLLMVNQLPLSCVIVPAVKLKFEAPLLVRLSVCAVDCEVPTCCVKLILAGDRIMAGLPLTTKVT